MLGTASRSLRTPCRPRDAGRSTQPERDKEPSHDHSQPHPSPHRHRRPLGPRARRCRAPAAETAAQRYTANLVNDDPREGRKIETLQIEIARLSTPEELAALATADAKKAEEIGSAKLDRTTSRAAVAAVETNGAWARS